MVTFLFRSALSEQKEATLHKKRRWSGGWSSATVMDRTCKRPVVSSNKMPEESKRAERSTISVDLLRLESIGDTNLIDRR